MKSLRALVILIFTMSSSVFPQYFSWQWQNSQPYGFSLQHSVILPNNSYLLFGEKSTILTSVDQGLSWTRSSPDSLNGFRDIYSAYFIDNNTGFFCGEGGMICKTTDGGLTWNYQSSGVTTNLLEITFYDANLGFAGGSSAVLLKTTNGGNNWTQISTGSTSGEIYRINIAPGTNGAVIYIGSGVAAIGRFSKSTDSGNTWQATPGYSLTTVVRGVSFLDADTGYIANGVYQIFKTTNGGLTFAEVADPGSGSFYDLKIIAPGIIAAAGSRGELYKSTDWGNSWQLFNTLINTTIYSLSFRNNDLLVAGPGGTISKSSDSGNTWNLLSKTATLEELRNVQFINNQVGYAVGGSTSTGVVLKTTDGGENWTLLPFSTDYRIRSQFWLDENVGFVGKRGQYGIYRTTNGGITFDSVNTGTAPSTLNWNVIAFANADTGYIGGDDGNYCKTTNGGLTWTVIPFSLHHGPYIIYNMSVIDARTVISTGAVGKVFKTTDGGVTFSDLSNLGTTSAMYGIDFLNSTQGYIVGSSGRIYLTTDGGNSWILSTAGLGSTTMYSVKAVNDHIVWASGSSGTVVYSTDAGMNWYISTSFPVYSLIRTMYGMNFFNGNLWVVGSSGIIIKGFSDPVPVELISFNIETSGDELILRWKTSTETNNKGFDIERRRKDYQNWEKIGYVPGNGTTTNLSEYEFRDKVNGTFLYRIKQIDLDGSYNYSNEIEGSINLLTSYTLEQNYPNPFNPSTVISFQIPKDEYVSLKIYDVLGNLLDVLINEKKSAGKYSISYKASDLSSGIYIYKIMMGNITQSKKMILIK